MPLLVQLPVFWRRVTQARSFLATLMLVFLSTSQVPSLATAGNLYPLDFDPLHDLPLPPTSAQAGGLATTAAAVAVGQGLRFPTEHPDPAGPATAPVRTPSPTLWVNEAALAADASPGAADAATTTTIPLAELGQRADAQSPAPAPVLTAGQATLAAPLQALRGEIGPAGLTVESTSASEGGGRFRLTPTHLGKGETPLSLPPGAVRLRDQAVVLDRGPLTEVLSASGDGLRQDFVVAQPPAGAGPLTLTLALEGATASAAPRGVALTLPGGRRLVYGGLHITDAAGQVVDGTLAVADAHTLTISVTDTSARYPLTIDPTISDADWQALNPGIPGANGSVKAMVFDSGSGRLYVGGDFTAIGTVLANHIAQWDGSAWSALGSGLSDCDGYYSCVYALAVSDGDVYVGGGFTTAGGIGANYIAKWNGSAWKALGSGVNYRVYALAVSGSDLYVGGDFWGAGGTSANSIAKWDGSAWSALGSGLDGCSYFCVSALAVSGSDLYVGGEFTTAGGTSANNIAKWDGSVWSALGSGVSGHVRALAVSGSDLYVGGGFTTAGVTPANNIAKWDGSVWSALGSGVSGYVRALAVSGSDLYVGGLFTTAGGSAANNIAKWDGSAWSDLGSGLGNYFSSPYVHTLAVSGSDLYAGGDFTSAGGSAANNIAKWDGSAWSDLGSGLGGDDPFVSALGVSGSDLYVGGSFTRVGDTPANAIAKWDGSTWSALGSGLGYGTFPPRVHALAVSGSDLYVGGFFTTAGGSGANYIAKWNGSGWSALGSGLDAYVYTLAVSGSDLYVGGQFKTAGGTGANYIAKWNGSAWSALGRGLGGGLNNFTWVKALAVSGSDLYVGGRFTTAGGNAANNIAKWNGSAWSALGSGLKSDVTALAVSGSDLYVGGYFTTTADGSAANYIAKWNGSAWSALSSGLDDWVNTLAVSGTDLYVGGNFTTAGSSSANHIAKWDGSAWSAIGSGLNDRVDALAVSGTDLYVGGVFTTAGGKLSPYLAAVNLLTDNCTLTVAKAGTGNGTVGGGGTYACNTMVTPTATPATGSTFTGWTPTSCGSPFPLTDDMTCTATFTLNPYTLTVNKSGTGTVTSAPAGINCGTTCSAPFAAGSSVVLTATAGTGYQFDKWAAGCTSSSGNTCTMTMSADKTMTATFSQNPSTVTISATNATATEAGLTTGTFTFTRSGDTSAALTVNYTVSGTATAGSDYTSLGTSVTIAAGATSATLTVTPLQDSLVESDETVILTLATGTGYTVGTASSATVTLSSDDTNTVTVTASDASATEAGLTTGTFTFTRSGDTSAALTVNYTVSGTATAGSDYTSLGTSVNIAAGATSATLTVTPVDDTLVEADETVTLTLVTGTGYTVGIPDSATVTLRSDDTLPGEDLTIKASDISGNGVHEFQATGNITVTGEVNVRNGVQLIISAGKKIVFQPGFKVEAGGRLNAHIGTSP